MPWHTSVWSQAVAAGAPALLVHGPAGIGERTFALALAAAWLCEAATGTRPCGECASCRLLSAGNHPDLRLLEPESLAATLEAGDDEEGGGEDKGGGDERSGGDRKLSQDIRIAQLRELAELAQLTSHRGGARVVLIHPVDTMNIAAANALLKLLEEPPAGMRFVLVAHRLQRVSATVLSRCMRVALPAPARADALAWLLAQGIDDPEAALALAGGAPLGALVGADPVRAAMYRAWLRCVEDSSAAALAAARDTKDAGPAQVLMWLVQWTHDLARVKAGATPRYYPRQTDALERSATKLTLRAITRLHRTLVHKQRWIRHPLNAQLSLEALWIDFLQGIGGG